MYFVHIHRAFVNISLPLVFAPGVILRFIAALVDLGGSGWPGLIMRSVRIRLHTDLAVPALDAVFIGSELLQPGDAAFPYAAPDGVHGGLTSVPAVEISHQGNGSGMGRPDPEAMILCTLAGYRVCD